MPDDIWIQIVVLVVCLILNIINSAAVTAFTDCDDNVLLDGLKNDKKKATRAIKILGDRTRFYTTTDFISIIAHFGMGYVLVTLLDKLTELPSWGDILIAIGLVMLVEVFTIKIPKRVAGRHPEKAFKAHSALIRFGMIVLKPFSFFCESLANLILKPFKYRADEDEEVVTEEEIISSVEEAQESGVLEEDEAAMINKIFSFDDKQVSEIMTHRMNVTALKADEPFLEAVKEIFNSNFSRYPVFEESIENIIGIVHIKDLMAYMLEHDHKELENVTIREFIRKPYLVPDTQNINDLFHELQQQKVQMAIAIDEYGQTAGIVTMEDILEEIVGEIQDEYDEEQEDVVVKKADVLIVNGLITLSELSEELDDEIESEDFDTLNGLLTSLLDHIPTEDDRTELLYSGYKFRILEVANHIISKVKVTKQEPEKMENEENLA